MTPTHDEQQRRPGLPDPAAILQAVPFTPQRAASARGDLQAAGPVTYQILHTTEADAYDPPPEAAGPEGGRGLPAAPAGDDFHGTSRRAAKLSLGSGPLAVLPDLLDLIHSLPPDPTMIHHHPPILDTATSRRVPEEQRNVQVRAFLYAASRESDNDFHLIIGRDVHLTPHRYLTMELSGLPPPGNATRATLTAVRTAFTHFFGAQLPGPHYDFYNPPIPIEIQGSLFFDVHHATGPHPGPPSLQADMPTIWEVHPVTNIVFEP